MNKRSLALIALACFAVAIAEAQTTRWRPLTLVYQNNDFQITGVTVSRTGRLFVNFPLWSTEYLNAVVEVQKDGTAKPFPDEYWNRWDRKRDTARKQFVCVQSVVVDDTDTLWVVDAAAPMLASPVPGGAKLVKIDLQTNRVVWACFLGRMWYCRTVI
ncbi:MAG: hypothetical protein ACR2JB_24860 [Bryobacteraceae bacterium]